MTWTVYCPALPVHESVEVCEAPRTILAGVRVQERPTGLAKAVRATVPVNPLVGETVTVEVPGAPASALTCEGLAAMV